MFTRFSLAALLLCPASALANSDEISPVPTQAIVGHPYLGENTPSRIRFINVRNRPVRLIWITFEGGEKEYAMLSPGQEIILPTFVAHRWIVKDVGDDAPQHAFISTRSAARDNGTAQIALIR